MNCPSCGIENPERARYCMECAARLETTTEDLARSASPIATSNGFVGRQREMEQLITALEDVLAGHGRLVMLAGEPGIGKTRTAQELSLYAETQGFVVLWGRCYEGEGAPPYWPWIKPLQSYIDQYEDEDLAKDLGSGGGSIASIFPELGNRLPGLEAPAVLDAEQARFRFFNSLATFLKNASRRQPLVLILEDLHWADRSSLLLLEFVAREIASTPILILGTYRDVEVNRRHPLSQTLGVLIREQEFSRLQLRGLNQTAVAEILRSAKGSEPSEAMVETVLGRTEGNPLFIAEISRVMEREGDQELAGLLEGIKDVIGWRLNRLTEECNEVLTIASVLGREFSYLKLRLLVSHELENRLEELLEEALVSRVIEELPQGDGGFQFSHALIQETLAGELSITRRVRLHAQIAQELGKHYGSNAPHHAAELVYHFIQAETLLGSEKLVHYSLLAGEEALAQFADTDAMAHFQRALSSKQGNLVGTEAARLLFGYGRSQILHAEPDLLTEGLRNLQKAFDFYLEAGEVDQAIAIAEYPLPTISTERTSMARFITQALTVVPSGSLAEGRLLCSHGSELGRVEANLEESLEALSRALKIALQEKDVSLESRSLAEIANVEYFHLRFDHCRERLLRSNLLAEQVSDFQIMFRTQLDLCRLAMMFGELSEAQERSDSAIQLAEKLQNRRDLARALRQGSNLYSVQGRWADSHELAQQGFVLRPYDVASLSAQAILEYELGNQLEGQEYLDRLLEVTKSASRSAVGAHAVSAFALGRLGEITRDPGHFDFCRSAADIALSSHLTEPSFAQLAYAGLAIAAALQGDREAAANVYERLHTERPQMLGPGWASYGRLMGQLSRTLADIGQAVAHFQEGLALCRRGYGPELAWTCFNYAETLLERDSSGDREMVISLLDEALPISTNLGMHPLSERLAHIQAQTRFLVSPSYPDGLSQREVEVLRLVAAGKNNREIAAELVVSVGTVANHVTSILNKANLSNRTEAAGYAFRHGLV